MRSSIRFTLASGLVGVALFSSHCSGAVEKGTVDAGPDATPSGLPTPLHHRPTAAACSTSPKSAACVTDTDCGKTGVCECGTHSCVPGNCRVDADCGSGGYCSPTFDTCCGPFDGIVGFYCHTPKDKCENDSECVENGNTGYCAYQSTTGNWECSYSFCAG